MSHAASGEGGVVTRPMVPLDTVVLFARTILDRVPTLSQQAEEEVGEAFDLLLSGADRATRRALTEDTP